ncbi:hypothetical protein QU38_01290, partial [Staphylococcus aureus]
ALYPGQGALALGGHPGDRRQLRRQGSLWRARRADPGRPALRPPARVRGRHPLFGLFDRRRRDVVEGGWRVLAGEELQDPRPLSAGGACAERDRALFGGDQHRAAGDRLLQRDRRQSYRGRACLLRQFAGRAGERDRRVPAGE